MRDLIFLVKAILLTTIIVLILQIQVGQRTLETHALIWIHTSPLIAPLNTVAQGAAKLYRDNFERKKSEEKSTVER